MKKYLIQYKPFLLFIGVFFVAYVLLTLIYQYYLSRFGTAGELDGITKLVGNHTERLLQLFNDDVKFEKIPSEPYVRISYNEKIVASIVEGCNAISVIILFVSFIIAFSGKLKSTLLYVLGGSLFIYILNICRIASLCALLYYFPEKSHFLHGVLFPLVIYGLVFILWIVWVSKFSRYAK
ncbi:exosortase family protein XrtF [Flavobacterium sp. LS1R47]|uniref:Exosortase family protein XrtF n=1 Tax=Flavobacterium frigoritolerans TaxID=2987686 RepID=A0A9X2ZJC8_9FLAO|nr:exosortase family protein XrtF [Flavobacterium frigoritolerans]MCV9932551.1 exosortase family protein XrtF [Flavobacterium frigoritolerans]